MSTTPFPQDAGQGQPRRDSVFRRPMLYADMLKWFILLSALDVMFTAIVLHMGGREVNAVARKVLEAGDLHGLIGFKFFMVVLVILLCDFVGRRNDARGRFIARMSIMITAVPVIMAIVQLIAYVHF